MNLPFDSDEFMADKYVRKAFKFVEEYLTNKIPYLVVELAKESLADQGISYEEAMNKAKEAAAEFDFTCMLEDSIEGYFEMIEDL